MENIFNKYSSYLEFVAHANTVLHPEIMSFKSQLNKLAPEQRELTYQALNKEIKNFQLAYANFASTNSAANQYAPMMSRKINDMLNDLHETK